MMPISIMLINGQCFSWEMGMVHPEGQTYQQPHPLNLERMARFWELEGLPLRRFAAKAGMGPWDARRYLIAHIDYPLWKVRNAQYAAKQKERFDVSARLGESRLAAGKILVAGYICSLAQEEGAAAVNALEYLFTHPTHHEVDIWYQGLYELFGKMERIKAAGRTPKVVELLGGLISEREIYRIGHEIGIPMRKHTRKKKSATKSSLALEQSSDSSQGQPIG
jgi:hypothetical protein